MKEVNIDQDLSKQINNTNKQQKGYRFLLISLGLLASLGVGIGLTSLIGQTTAQFSYLVFAVGFGTFELGKIIYDTVKTIKADQCIERLSDKLSGRDVKVNEDTIKKAISAEKASLTINYDNKNKLDTNKEIIKHFYMLDEQDQIVVLQETLRTCKSEDGTYDEVRNLFLLEPEDMKNIEMPNIVKSLSFEDNKKKKK